MSDPGSGGAPLPGDAPLPPPPGWQPPPRPRPSYTGQTVSAAPPPPGWAPSGTGWAPAPGMLGAAHKPGAVPLRPLGLGDIYEAAFRIIRFNPQATVGSAVLVAALVWLVPVVVTALLSLTVDLSLQATGDDGTDVVGAVGSVSSFGVSFALLFVGTILVTGVVSHVTAAAAVGRRLTLGEAWAATRGRRWRLAGLAALLIVTTLLLLGGYVLLWVLVVSVTGGVLPVLAWGLLSVPAFACLLFFFWIRVYYLPVPALMLEQVGVLGALRRGYRLTARQFWRTFGIALLTFLVTWVAGTVLGFPIGIIGGLAQVAVGDRYALLVVVVTQALAQVVSAAFVTPFTSTVISLQYLDKRIRKEAFDVELMQRAGITAS